MAMPEKQGVILLVDDEPAIVSVMTAFLKNLNYWVISTSSSLEALTLFEQNAQDISVVITDLSMPGLSGAELTKKIKGDYPEIPFILFTGYGETIGRQKTTGIDISAFIAKPTTQGVLASTLQTVLTGQRKN